MIRRVVVRRPRPDTVEATVVWVSGATTGLTLHPAVAHTADLRRGAQSSGWHNIPHLGVFIWWLQSFPVIAATPVL